MDSRSQLTPRSNEADCGPSGERRRLKIQQSPAPLGPHLRPGAPDSPRLRPSVPRPGRPATPQTRLHSEATCPGPSAPVPLLPVPGPPRTRPPPDPRHPFTSSWDSCPSRDTRPPRPCLSHCPQLSCHQQLHRRLPEGLLPKEGMEFQKCCRLNHSKVSLRTRQN